MKLTHLSLFSGIGGADLAASWAGIETVAFSEIDPYCCKVLEKNFSGVPNLGDIHNVTKESFYETTGNETVDVISGGFPCQPWSVAGKQRGKEDDRHLWPEMLRVVKELRPTWVIGENVAGFVKLGLDDALSDLEAQGYEARAFVLPACAIGAPHQRQRVFIVGHTEHDGSSASKITKGIGETGCNDAQGTNAASEPSGASLRRNGKDVADAQSVGQQWNQGVWNQFTDTRRRKMELKRRCYAAWRQWAVEPDVGRVAHGVPNRAHRLKALGNAIVPQQIYPIFEAISEIEKGGQQWLI